MITMKKAAALVVLATALAVAQAALAQKSGGILRTYNSSNPPGISIVEEATVATAFAAAPIFNNLVQFDQAKPRNGFDTIVPDLAESWALDASRTRLTFKLRRGVKWHDGKPFSAKDVQCTWHRLIGKDPESFRKNPRKEWWDNIKEVTIKGDEEATFVLERPQPSLLALLASNYSAVYPCHVTPAAMRTKPVGTGPFKFVTFDSNNVIRLAKNAEYWKPGRPYLDGIEIRIVPNRSTRILAFAANEFDLTFVADITPPLVGDIMARSPNAVCKMVPAGVTSNLLVNRTKAPFDNERLRKAMMLALDRKAMNDIVALGKSSYGGAMLPPPQGNWGVANIDTLPNYGGDPAQRQAEARKIMESLGYGPSKRLKIKVATRDFQAYKDPAVLLVDQLNKIYFDAELDVIESSVYYGRVTRGDYFVGLNLTGSAVDDPDVTIAENYSCKSERNYTKYCNQQVEKLIDAQSMEADFAKRKDLVWQIEKILAEDGARPIILHTVGATCWHPHMKGFVLHENSIYNNWRFEGVWLDK
jgi:peptide/nickel transport system substrate-binding protein